MHCVNAVEKVFQSGSIICVYGRRKQMIGLMIDGEAKLVKLHEDGRQTVLEYLKKDSLFGEPFALPGDYMDQLQVVCTKEATVQFMEYQNLLHQCKTPCGSHEDVVDEVMRMLSRKSALQNERIQVLTQPTIRKKLQCYFELTEAKTNEKTVQLPFSYSALAEYLSVDRSALMRELKNMREDGEIQVNKRQITLR